MPTLLLLMDFVLETVERFPERLVPSRQTFGFRFSRENGTFPKFKSERNVDRLQEKDTVVAVQADPKISTRKLGCDGANSQIRRAMQVHYLNWNYNQMGIVATLKLEEESDNVVAWQRFLPTGPIALLPLTKKISSLVWSTTPQHAKHLISLSETEFVDTLNNSLWKAYEHHGVIQQATSAFDGLLRFLNCPSDATRQFPPKIIGCEDGSRAGFPLGFGHSTSYIRKGVALVGDAAHRVHPLAGQGVNLGFGDITCLNKILGEAAYSGSPLDNLMYLKEYETERQRHNIPTMLAVEGIHRLYNTEFTPLVLLRSLGLQATHALGPLKRAIIAQAAV